MVYSGRVCGFVCHLRRFCCSRLGMFKMSRVRYGDEESAVMCKSRIEGPGTSYKLLKVPYFLWLTTGALVSVTFRQSIT